MRTRLKFGLLALFACSAVLPPRTRRRCGAAAMAVAARIDRGVVNVSRRIDAVMKKMVDEGCRRRHR